MELACFVRGQNSVVQSVAGRCPARVRSAPAKNSPERSIRIAYGGGLRRLVRGGRTREEEAVRGKMHDSRTACSFEAVLRAMLPV